MATSTPEKTYHDTIADYDNPFELWFVASQVYTENDGKASEPIVEQQTGIESTFSFLSNQKSPSEPKEPPLEPSFSWTPGDEMQFSVRTIARGSDIDGRAAVATGRSLHHHLEQIALNDHSKQALYAGISTIMGSWSITSTTPWERPHSRIPTFKQVHKVKRVSTQARARQIIWEDQTGPLNFDKRSRRPSIGTISDGEDYGRLNLFAVVDQVRSNPNHKPDFKNIRGSVDSTTCYIPDCEDCKRAEEPETSNQAQESLKSFSDPEIDLDPTNVQQIADNTTCYILNCENCARAEEPETDDRT